MSIAYAYRTRSNLEHRAASEIRRAGIKAYVPRDRGGARSPFTGKHPTPSVGWVFSAEPYHPAHGRQWCIPIGPVSKAEIAGLYLELPKRGPKPRPFAPGDRVTIKVGPFAQLTGTVVKDRGRIYIVEIPLFNSTTQAAIHEDHLRAA
jgi:hypothetical protein